MAAIPFAGAVERLNPRERLLLGLMGLVVALFLLFLVQHGVSSGLDDLQTENEDNADVLREIARNRARFRESERRRRDLDRRYATKAPALQGFLEEKATSRGVEIRDAQDRPEVAHGKQFVERSVQIRLNKVEIRPFVQLMEDVTTSRHPMAITKLRVRRRIAEPNSFDVDMTVSAFDRIGGPSPSKARARPGRGPWTRPGASALPDPGSAARKETK